MSSAARFICHTVTQTIEENSIQRPVEFESSFQLREVNESLKKTKDPLCIQEEESKIEMLGESVAKSALDYFTFSCHLFFQSK